MDKLKSLVLEQQLKNKDVNGFTILQLINNGKSAAVFKAEKDGELYALKIFDNELIERFGHEIQTKRIEQEISLNNHNIENLVKIFDGGHTTVEGQVYFFIVMEFIDGKNLKDYIKTEEISQEFVLEILETLNNTTEKLLLEREIAHRDIKPENIMIGNNRKVILMDLGVLKLVGLKSFSDEEEKSFVGTLRYAPPEFLTRTEADTIEGWRAVNLYQIGATLHDLIMKSELFIDKIPYPNLVIAINYDTPKITNTFYAFDLLQLARDMMSKDWKIRLKLVTSQRIRETVSIKNNAYTALDETIEEVLKMRVGHIANFDEIENLKRSKTELKAKQEDLAKKLIVVIDKCFEKIRTKGVFTKFAKSSLIQFSGDSNSGNKLQTYMYELEGNLIMGFPTYLYLLIRISNDENNYCEIDGIGLFAPVDEKLRYNQPNQIIKKYIVPKLTLGQQINRVGTSPIVFNFKTLNLFTGIVEIDENFEDNLSNKIVQVILKSLKAVEKFVEEKIQIQKQIAASKTTIQINQQSYAPIIIDSLE